MRIQEDGHVARVVKWLIARLGVAMSWLGTIIGVEIRPVLWLSTGHVEANLANNLDERTESPEPVVIPDAIIYGVPNGWLIRFSEGDQQFAAGGPLKDIARHARSCGAQWVRFDCDANATKDLPFWER
ncbi:MAG: hypothetical protein SF172_04205 [Burkholderiales bacterium]|nr:hypothetical protein [Burkholderiales bacterium]